ncbi:MAG TPA: hypothetical protein VIQ30_06190, partial [Pseudonocardia sp.]
MPQQGRAAEPGPWERVAGGSPGIGDPHLDPLVDVRVGDRLRDQQAAGGEELGHPVEQGRWVAADADVAVDQ